MIEFTHMQGLKIGVYTVNSAHRIIELKQLGVDAVFTDDLKLFSEKE
jgi:glycerophosphoryl diester phosphodiesterase